MSTVCMYLYMCVYIYIDILVENMYIVIPVPILIPMPMSIPIPILSQPSVACLRRSTGPPSADPVEGLMT